MKFLDWFCPPPSPTVHRLERLEGGAISLRDELAALRREHGILSRRTKQREDYLTNLAACLRRDLDLLSCAVAAMEAGAVTDADLAALAAIQAKIDRPPIPTEPT